MSQEKTKTISPSILPILPNDIILDILSRLPAKSLLRLQGILDDELSNCVETSSFKHKHALNQSTNALLMVSNSGRAIHKIDLSLNPCRSISSSKFSSITQTYDLKQLFKDIPPLKWANIQRSWIIGTSNGLICLYFKLSHMVKRPKLPYELRDCHRIERFKSYSQIKTLGMSGRDVRETSNHLVLWNPCIGEHHFLPGTERFPNVFSSFIGGFGYDVANKTYKVVIGHGSLTRFYDLSTNLWKTIDTIGIDKSNRVYFESFGKYLNGALHWTVSKTEIVAFDLSSEVSTRLELPHCCSTHNNPFDFLVLNGCLSVSCYRSEANELSIWTMKEYGRVESWSNMLITKLDPNKYDILTSEIQYRPRLSWASHDHEILFFLNKDMVAYWFPKDEKLRYFEDLKVETSLGIVHVDTLVSPKPWVSNIDKDDNNKALVVN